MTRVCSCALREVEKKTSICVTVGSFFLSSLRPDGLRVSKSVTWMRSCA